MEILKTYFESVGFNAIDCETISCCFKYKLFKKNELFVAEEKVSLQLGFVETGIFQYFSVTEAGDEITTYISLPNTFVASLLTYLTETPSRENIRALTDSKLWVIQKKDVIELQSKIPGFKDFYIKLIEWQICCIDKSRLDFLTLTAEERYEKLLKEQPEYLQQVPLQYIASMLGVTPRHLSRLRNKI